jgi:hypothetical protein
MRDIAGTDLAKGISRARIQQDGEADPVPAHLHRPPAVPAPACCALLHLRRVQVRESDGLVSAKRPGRRRWRGGTGVIGAE